jgi:ABC-type uncharacterized transport system involved in gliding motility auxiliary subunit
MKPQNPTLSRRIYAIAAVVLAAIIFVAINIAANSGLTDAKLDLTENGQFTLSPGTKHIIAQLKEPVTLRFFYSKKVAADYAQIDAYARRVSDMLQNYAARSNGKIVLETVDPERFTAEEDEATANGLTAAPTDSGSAVYFGLVASNTVGDKEVVPFFSAEREPYLEYDLSALIYRLSHPKKAKVAILTSLPLDGGMQMMMQGGAQPNMIYAQLQQSRIRKWRRCPMAARQPRPTCPNCCRRGASSTIPRKCWATARWRKRCRHPAIRAIPRCAIRSGSI